MYLNKFIRKLFRTDNYLCGRLYAYWAAILL